MNSIDDIHNVPDHMDNSGFSPNLAGATASAPASGPGFSEAAAMQLKGVEMTDEEFAAAAAAHDARVMAATVAGSVVVQTTDLAEFVRTIGLPISAC